MQFTPIYCKFYKLAIQFYTVKKIIANSCNKNLTKKDYFNSC